MADITNMPTIDDLRMMLPRRSPTGATRMPAERLWALRRAWTTCRSARELSMLGAPEVYDQEYRRSELIKRGFTPPAFVIRTQH